MDYNFLANLTLVDTGRLRTPKTNTPTGLTLRIFANGNIYPSKELVEKFSLEYTTKEQQHTRNGFDIVDSTEWEPTKELPRMILLGVVPKTESKVDLLAGVRYNEDGTPKSSVMTQGTGSETLLDLVRSMGYLTGEQKYCDLQFVVDYPIKTEDGLSFIPKIIARGPNAGEKTYEKREDVTFYVVNTPENLEAKPEPQKQATINTVIN